MGVAPGRVWRIGVNKGRPRCVAIVPLVGPSQLLRFGLNKVPQAPFFRATSASRKRRSTTYRIQLIRVIPRDAMQDLDGLAYRSPKRA